jgi:hypothetical protein
MQEKTIPKIYPAPNGKFYLLWRRQPVCTPAGALRYFETEGEARRFLAGTNDTASSDKVAA